MNRSKYCLGVDIQDYYIGIVELCRGPVLKICNAIYEPIRETAEQTLTEILFAQKFHTKQCFLSISSLKVIKKKLSFSKILNEFDILNELTLHQPHYFDHLEEPLALDFQSPEENNDQNDYLIFAARTSDIAQKIHLLKTRHLNPVCVEPDYQALLRLIFLDPAVKPLDDDDSYSMRSDEAILLLFPQKIIIAHKNQHLWDTSLDNDLTENDMQQIILDFSIKYPGKKISAIYSFVDIDFSSLSIPIKKTNLPVQNELLLAFGLALRNHHSNDINFIPWRRKKAWKNFISFLCLIEIIILIISLISVAIILAENKKIEQFDKHQSHQDEQKISKLTQKKETLLRDISDYKKAKKTLNQQYQLLLAYPENDLIIENKPRKIL